MKSLLTLALAAIVSLSSALRAEEPAHSQGCPDLISGAYTNVLNNAAVGSSSVGITVGANTVTYVRSTGTVGTNLTYQFSSDNVTWSTLTGGAMFHGSWCIQKRGRYLRFGIQGPQSGTGTVDYYLSSGASSTVAGMGDLSTTVQTLSNDMKILTLTAQTISNDLKTLTLTAQTTSNDLKTLTLTAQTISNDLKTLTLTAQTTSNDLKTLTLTAQTISNDLRYLTGTVATQASLAQVFAALTTAANASWHNVTIVAISSLTQSVTSQNLTTLAGSAAYPLGVWVRAHGGGASIAYEITASITPPGVLAVSAGNYAGTGTTTQITGPFPAGHAIHHVVSGTAAVTGSLGLYQWY